MPVSPSRSAAMFRPPRSHWQINPSDHSSHPVSQRSQARKHLIPHLQPVNTWVSSGGQEPAGQLPDGCRVTPKATGCLFRRASQNGGAGGHGRSKLHGSTLSRLASPPGCNLFSLNRRHATSAWHGEQVCLRSRAGGDGARKHCRQDSFEVGNDDATGGNRRWLYGGREGGRCDGLDDRDVCRQSPSSSSTSCCKLKNDLLPDLNHRKASQRRALRIPSNARRAIWQRAMSNHGTRGAGVRRCGACCGRMLKRRKGKGKGEEPRGLENFRAKGWRHSAGASVWPRNAHSLEIGFGPALAASFAPSQMASKVGPWGQSAGCCIIGAELNILFHPLLSKYGRDRELTGRVPSRATMLASEPPPLATLWRPSGDPLGP